MEELRIEERLVRFGLTRQEAAVYLCLLQSQDMTGYEAAKMTGISRSNVYSALSGLTEKGAAYIIEGNPSKYVAVSARVFCENKIRVLQEEMEYLGRHVPKAVEYSDGYITIQGYRHILDKVRYMIEEAQCRMYLDAPSEFLIKVRDALLQAAASGKKVVLISDCEVPGLNLPLYVSKDRKEEIRMITDSSFVLTGEVSGGGGDTCLFSGQKNFVSVFKEALGNKIKLIEREENKDGN